MDWKTTMYQLDSGKVSAISDLTSEKGMVLFFYPRANASHCTLEAKEFEKHVSEIEAKGYSVIGVSRDPLMEQDKFSKNCLLSFPLISDTDEILHKEFKTLPKEGEMYTSRSTFVLDNALNIKIEMRDVHEVDHVSELIAML